MDREVTATVIHSFWQMPASNRIIASKILIAIAHLDRTSGEIVSVPSNGNLRAIKNRNNESATHTRLIPRHTEIAPMRLRRKTRGALTAQSSANGATAGRM